MRKFALISGAAFGFLGVALGAFGAHALKPALIEMGRLDTYELAVKYLFYHALALVATGILAELRPTIHFKYSAVCFFTGILFFSGSLFALSFSGLGVLGAITPIGGFLLLVGWAFLLIGALREGK